MLVAIAQGKVASLRPSRRSSHQKLRFADSMDTLLSHALV